MTVKKTLLWEYGKGPIVEKVYEGTAPRNYTSLRPRALPAHPCLEDTQTIRGELQRIAEPMTVTNIGDSHDARLSTLDQ